MTGLTHLLVGAAVGGKIRDPIKVAGIAFASHFLLDALPHNDYIYFYLGGDPFSPGIVSGASVLIALLVVFFLLKNKREWRIGALGAFFAALPDVITTLTYHLGAEEFWFNRLHRGVHLTDLGEIFYRLSGGVVEHTQVVSQWRENFNLLSTSPAAQLGWGLELAAEILLIFLLVLYLRGRVLSS